jgi:hypothetical protein
VVPERERQIRQQLASLARQPSKRVTEFSVEQPTEWQPYAVRNPEWPDLFFSDASAWALIADHLESGVSIQEVDLEKPQGKKGYVLLIQVGPVHVVYVKLQLGAAGKIIGRSFHYSTR